MAARSIISRYRNLSGFVRTLLAAELMARNEWEFRFTNEMRSRLEKHGERTSLSDREAQQLGRLAAKF